jgi:hypothetical protein
MNICQMILLILSLLAVGVAFSAYYLRSWLWVALWWTLDTVPMILVYNFMGDYMILFGLMCIAYAIGFPDIFTYQNLFKTASFAKRDELNSMGFYEEDNLQRGTYLTYPASIDEYQKIANQSFKTISSMMLVVLTAIIFNVIICLIPDTRYIIKSMSHVASVLVVMVSHAEFFEILWYDLKIITKIPEEPEVDDEPEDEIILPRPGRGRRRNRNQLERARDDIAIHIPVIPANQVPNNAPENHNLNNQEEDNPLANIELVAPVAENPQPNPRIAVPRQVVNPRPANRQAARRGMRRQPNSHNNLAYYPKRHGYDQQNRSTTVSFTFMSSFAIYTTYYSLRLTGKAIASVILLMYG